MPKLPKPLPELTALVNPNLDGAACTGMAPLFDAPAKNEPLHQLEDRHDQAREICGMCPVRIQCGRALLDLPLGQREGIWAGVDATQVTTTIHEEDAA